MSSFSVLIFALVLTFEFFMFVTKYTYEDILKRAQNIVIATHSTFL